MYHSDHIISVIILISLVSQATNQLLVLESQLFGLAFHLVDNPQYMPPPKPAPTLAENTSGSDNVSPATSPGDAPDSENHNPGATAEKGKKKNPVDQEAADFLRESREYFDDLDDILMGDRHAHAVASNVCTNFPQFDPLY